MLQKTRGIVLKTTEYGESSLVVKIYTEQFGLQSYIINSVRKKHPKFHANLFQPLTPVDLVVYQKEKPGLHRISEIRPSPPLGGIPFDVVKTSLIFFLDEVLYKSIREEESNLQLFDFILQSIEWLDHSQNAPPDFHLIFLIMLSRYLGFGPTRNYTEQNQVFNLRDGHYQTSYPEHANFIPPPLSGIFLQLLSANYSSELTISNAERKKLIEYLLEYYALHVEGFGEIKAKKVLEEIWNT
jgi:DNA repair protein RecO (recombination protein O)